VRKRRRANRVAGLLLLALMGCHPARSTPAPVSIATSYEIPSATLGQIRRINVYFPPDYAEGTRDYPVLYLLDGGIREDFLHVAGIASLAADFRNIREFILVGIEGIDRYHDLTYPTSEESERQRLPTSGGSAAFRNFLGSELEPFVKQHFRVTDESVIMGESAAGMFVVESFLKEPDLFQGYVAVSPMLWWDHQSLAHSADSLLQKPFPAGRRLYLTIADEGGEMRQGVDLLVTALRIHAPADLKWTFVPMAQETHGTTFHPAALAAVRKFFAITDSAAPSH
jgi:predicted alpha/beta superfamily hydrolase